MAPRKWATFVAATARASSALNRARVRLVSEHLYEMKVTMLVLEVVAVSFS